MEEPAPFVFCLVPPELSAELLEPLRAHFRDDPMIDVVVERRGARPDETVEERVRRELIDARHAEHRAPVVPREGVLESLPPKLAQHAGRLRFVQRLTPVRPGLEDRDILEVVDMMRAGVPDAPSELYWRSFERVRRRLMLHLRTHEEADGAVKGAFGRVFDRLDEFDATRHSLPAWLDSVVDDHVTELRRGNAAPGA